MFLESLISKYSISPEREAEEECVVVMHMQAGLILETQHVLLL